MKRVYDWAFGQNQWNESGKRRKTTPSFASASRNELDDGGANLGNVPGIATSREQSTDYPNENNKRVQDEASSLLQTRMASQRFCALNADDKGQYTDGDSGFMLSHDGTKECAALFMNFDLATKLQTFLKTERILTRANIRQIKQKEVLTEFRDYAESKIKRLKERRMAIEGNVDQVPRHDKYGRKINDLEQRLEEAEQLEVEAARAMRDAEQPERKARLQLSSLLEGVLLRSELIEKTDKVCIDPEVMERFRVPVKCDDSELSFQNALPPRRPYDELNSRRRTRDYRRYDDVSFGAGLSSRGSYASLEGRKASRQAKIKARDEYRAKVAAYWDAYRAVQKAQDEFDDRAFEHRKDTDLWRDQHANGVSPQETMTDLDRRHFRRGQQLTRNLIDAEAAFAEIKAKALEAAMDIGATDRSSGFVDGSQDGRDSCTLLPEERYHRPKVEEWLAGIPEPEWPFRLRRQSEPKDDRYDYPWVKPGESSTLIAEGNDRRRIDKWRQICGN